MSTRKITAVLLGVVLAASLLAGCSATDKPPKKEETEINNTIAVATENYTVSQSMME